jgi:outer membrane protein assembly factor BamB
VGSKRLAAVIVLGAFTVSAWAQAAGPAAAGPAAASGPAYLWRAATGGQVRSRPAVGPDGTVYALSEDSYLYAWVPGGSLRWKHDLGWIPWDCLAVADDGTVYAGLKNGDFLAVNPRGGRLWTARLDSSPSGDPAVSRDGTVVVGTASGTLAAFSHLGAREWSVTLPGAVRGSPVIDGAGTIYAAAADRRVYALTPWGEFRWSLPFNAVPDVHAVAADGTVVVGTDGGDLVGVSPSGDIRWKEALGSPVIGVAADALQLVAVTSDGRVVGFSADGRQLWKRAAARSLAAPPWAVGNGTLLAADDGSFLFYDSTHAAPKTFKTAAVGAAVITSEGLILVGGRDWIVYAINSASAGIPPAGGAPSAPWPQPGHDAQHSGRTEAVPPSDSRPPLESNPDYLYLQGLLGAPGRDGVQLFLSEVSRRVSSRTLAGSRWYAARQLESVVGYGLITQVRQNQKLVNDFPDLRAQAADLLGRIGSIGSRAALLRAVGAETDGVALAAEVHALGALASDGDGASLAAIARAFNRRAGGPPDERLASAVVDALGRIARYEGSLEDPSALSILIAVSGGSYADAARAAASAILHGDLKAYIFNQEE